jgi:hypothetical protein
MASPTLGELRDAVAATISTAVPALTVYPKVPDRVNLPCVIVMPTTATFGFTKAVPDDTWLFDLHVLTSRGDTELGQDALDAYISSGGPTSLREVIQRFTNLGIEGADASVRSRIAGVGNYGGQFEAAGISHVGATLQLVVTICGPR